MVTAIYRHLTINSLLRPLLVIETDAYFGHKLENNGSPSILLNGQPQTSTGTIGV